MTYPDFESSPPGVSVAEELRRIEQKLDEVLKHMKAIPGATTEFVEKTADDADLDGKYGNPEVRFTLKGWEDMVGRKFSECPSEFLEEYAKFLINLAKKNAKDPVKSKYAGWNAKDAARAKGWAFRNKGKDKGDPFEDPDPEASAPFHGDDAMDLPF